MNPFERCLLRGRSASSAGEYLPVNNVRMRVLDRDSSWAEDAHSSTVPRGAGAEDRFLGRRLLLLMLGWAFVASGCMSSKWGMDNAEYQKKYDRPYSDRPLKKWERMGRQMIDARHVANDSGVYIGGAASNFHQNPAGGMEVGVVNYWTPWLSRKVALAGQLNSGAANGFVGVDAAVHVSPPTRVAPFVGAGVFGGVDISTVIDTLSNDESTDTQFLGAVYPEAGVHVWLNGRTRLTGSASYWVTSLGHEKDFWYYGLGVTLGFGGAANSKDTGRLNQEDEYVNRLLDGRAERMTREAAAAQAAASNSEVTLTAGSAADVALEQSPTTSEDQSPQEMIVVPGPPPEFDDVLSKPLMLPRPPHKSDRREK